MNELQVFTNEELGKIRGIEIDGKPYVVANDIAKILGYANPSKATKDHCKKFKMVWGNDSLGRRQQFKVIPEGDIYRLIFSSKLPKAQEFEEWVMDKVLPQIRQTGGYIPYSQDESDEEFLARALIVAQNTLDKKNKLIEEMKPKVNYFDTFMNSQGCYTSTQVAKLFKLSSARKLNTILNENKIIYKQGNNWLPYSTTNKEWFKVTIGEKNTHNYSQLKFTPKGIYELSKLLNITLKEEDLQEITNNK